MEANKTFNAGLFAFTEQVNDYITDNIQFAEFVQNSIKRHLHGDWGELSEEDKCANDEALINDDRILSAYLLPKELETGFDDKIWIITSYDRTHTTVLFPSEY